MQYNEVVGSNGRTYDCGVELTLTNGDFARQEYRKHACRGTYTLHSLYLLLWANFGTFCLALLTQPDAEQHIQGPIIARQQIIKEYCFIQLQAMWKNLRDNLGFTEEQRSFFVMLAMDKVFKVRTQ